MSDAVIFGALAAATALIGRLGWRYASDWAGAAWEDETEAERRCRTLRRGAVGCYVAAGLLAAGALARAVVS